MNKARKLQEEVGKGVQYKSSYLQKKMQFIGVVRYLINHKVRGVNKARINIYKKLYKIKRFKYKINKKN